MNFTYKLIPTNGYNTIINVYLNGKTYEATERIIRSQPASNEEMQVWADSVRQQTPELTWDQPFNVGRARFFGTSGHAVSHSVSMRGVPAQAKPTHVA